MTAKDRSTELRDALAAAFAAGKPLHIPTGTYGVSTSKEGRQ